jgi:hypothetical protein
MCRKAGHVTQWPGEHCDEAARADHGAPTHRLGAHKLSYEIVLEIRVVSSILPPFVAVVWPAFQGGRMRCTALLWLQTSVVAAYVHPSPTPVRPRVALTNACGVLGTVLLTSPAAETVDLAYGSVERWSDIFLFTSSWTTPELPPDAFWRFALAGAAAHVVSEMLFLPVYASKTLAQCDAMRYPEGLEGMQQVVQDAGGDVRCADMYCPPAMPMNGRAEHTSAAGRSIPAWACRAELLAHLRPPPTHARLCSQVAVPGVGHDVRE